MVTDEQLTALAMAADPDAAVPDDAVPFRNVVGPDEPLLPSWYMPAPFAGGGLIRGWRRCALILLVLTFVIIEAHGLCSTYGQTPGVRVGAPPSSYLPDTPRPVPVAMGRDGSAHHSE